MIQFLEESAVAERIRIDKNGGRSPFLCSRYGVFTPCSRGAGAGEP